MAGPNQQHQKRNILCQGGNNVYVQSHYMHSLTILQLAMEICEQYYGRDPDNAGNVAINIEAMVQIMQDLCEVPIGQNLCRIYISFFYGVHKTICGFDVNCMSS